VIDTGSWRIPEILNFIGRNGKVDRAEMYQVFNMGIGMVAIVSQRDVAVAKRTLRARMIGRIERGTGKTKLP
jgi:phosphoribosylformylglycinamidine cyclo-ligase